MESEPEQAGKQRGKGRELSERLPLKREETA
jgi:hypothetical protein